MHFTEDALRSIARRTITKNTGARGLRSMLENVLMDAMYEVCDSHLLRYLFLLSQFLLVKDIINNLFHFLHQNTNYDLKSQSFVLQIPDVRIGDDIIDAVVVDTESLGTEGRVCGAKILNGKGALDLYLSQHEFKDSEKSAEGEVEVEQELPSIVAL